MVELMVDFLEDMILEEEEEDSDVFVDPTDLEFRILVAAGGSGCAGQFSGAYGGDLTGILFNLK